MVKKLINTEVGYKGKEGAYCKIGKKSELQEEQKHSMPSLPNAYSKPEV